MKKLIITLVLILTALSILGCNRSNDKDIQGVAYASLTRTEQVDMSNKQGVIKKINKLPENATIYDNNYNKDELYSVTFKLDSTDRKIVIFVDAKKNKKIGSLNE